MTKTPIADDIYTALMDKAKLLAERDALREQLRAAQSVNATALRTIEGHENDKRLAVRVLYETLNTIGTPPLTVDDIETESRIRSAILLLERDK